jgi:hypothetical protein
MVSAERWGSRSLATRFPRAHESALRPVATPLCHRSSSEEMAVTNTEKLDSSASSPSIVPSTEQPVKGAPPLASRTARNTDCWSNPIEANIKTKLLDSLATRNVGFVMSTHADASFGWHERTSSACEEHLSSGEVEQHLLRCLISPHHRANW